MRARAESLEEKQNLEREMKMMESKLQELRWKKEQQKLDTELKIRQAKEEAIETMEKKVDAYMMSSMPEEQDPQPEEWKQRSTEAQPTDCHEESKDMTKPAVPSFVAKPPSHSQDPESTPVQEIASSLVTLLSEQTKRLQLPPHRARCVQRRPHRFPCVAERLQDLHRSQMLLTQ